MGRMGGPEDARVARQEPVSIVQCILFRAQKEEDRIKHTSRMYILENNATGRLEMGCVVQKKWL